ncbi:xeroderma pigmentosum group C-complementing protein, partial [Phenoliferia sp. Uapishka_3]
MPTANDQVIALQASLKLPCGLLVPNRLAKAPMEEMLSQFGGGNPTEEHLVLYNAWAAGRWGMILTGNVMVSSSNLGTPFDIKIPLPTSPTYPRSMSAFRKWATASHGDDPCFRPAVIMQLCHTGRQSPRGAGRSLWTPSIAPSAIALDAGPGLMAKAFGKILWQTPVAMTEEDIDQVVDEFVKGARTAKETGFDGIQLHASHGYLLAQFLSPNVNLREDSYGGSPRARMKLLLRIITEIRKELPIKSGFCVGIKLNSSDYIEEDALDNVRWLAEHGGVDFIEISGGTYESPKFLQEDADSKPPQPSTQSTSREAFFLSFASQARALLQSIPSSSLPTPAPTIMVTGGFRTRAGMANAILSSSTDLIGIGRPSCADPALPKRLLDPSIQEARSPIYVVKGSRVMRWMPLQLLLPGVSTIFHTMLLAQIGRGEKPDFRMNVLQGFWRWGGNSTGVSDDSEDEDAWDEVDVEQDNRASTIAAAAAAAAGTESIEIVISKGGKGKGKKKKPDGSTTRDRMVRQERHKTHTICHLAVGLIRNRWLNDSLLKARLLSLVPLHLLNAFSSYNKSTHPNERDRSRLFDHALKDLVSWWYQSFQIDEAKGIRRRTLPDVEQELVEWPLEASTSEIPYGDAADDEGTSSKSKKKATSTKSKKGKGKQDIPLSPSELQGEEVHSAKSLMKRAILMKGSRDMSAQLFTSLCRALDLPARLVFSLQPLDWRAPSAAAKAGAKSRGKKKSVRGSEDEDEAMETDDDGKSTTSKSKGKGKGKATGGSKSKGKGKATGSAKSSTKGSTKGSEREDTGDETWEDGRGRMGYTLPPVNLRRSKPARRDLNRSPSPDTDEMSRRPVFWTEVWTRSNRHWIPVDPSRKKMRCRGIMEPSRTCVENQMLYVVAFEEDSFARDVTPRYAKSYSTFTAKARVPSKKGTEWFADLLKPYARTFQLNRDREEDEELWQRRSNEPMPTSVAGFKNHPSYVLEQHLHRDETILPGAKKLGMFRGTEIVYARSAVVTLKSEENWRRVGRVVKDDGEQPMKWVKQRHVTINRKRAENAALEMGEEATQQGLYAETQTEVFVPPPVVDGKIPKNDFGNIDLYVPSMLPAGAIHLPHKGAAKCAKALGIDYAEAVTGFEFRQRRANPILSGVVVAEEFGDLLVDAIINSQEAADEKEFAKRQERVLKRWKKLIVGLRIRQRLQASYHQVPAKVAPHKEESQFDPSARVVESAGPSRRKDLAASAAPTPEPRAVSPELVAPLVPRKRAASPEVAPPASENIIDIPSVHVPPAAPSPIRLTFKASLSAPPPPAPSDSDTASRSTGRTLRSATPRVDSTKSSSRSSSTTGRALRSSASNADLAEETPNRSTTGRTLRFINRSGDMPDDTPKRSSAGRTLRFTHSTEQAVAAKESKQEEAKTFKANSVISETDEEAEIASESDSGRESSLELESDF